MNLSLQDLLLYIPFHQLSFSTSLPEAPIHYDAIIDSIPDDNLKSRSLIILKELNECAKLNHNETVDVLIQDSNLMGIVICGDNRVTIQKETCNLFQQCGLPIIQIYEPSWVSLFQQSQEVLRPYSQLSKELNGFMEKGFENIILELSKALNTPFIYLNHEYQVLWQCGEGEILQEALRWLNTHLRDLISGDFASSNLDKGIQKNEGFSLFEPYFIHMDGLPEQILITSSNLVHWQQRMVDKLVGLTSLLLQTNELFREQQELFKEHFIYDLLYHKFESRNVMIKQGKTWGWNLEKPHHLLLINMEPDKEVGMDVNWMDGMLHHIIEQTIKLNERMIVVPFQDQVIVMIEDGEARTNNERKNHSYQIAKCLETELTKQWTTCQFNIGIGKWYQDTIDLNKSYQEAQLALQFGDKWYENKQVFHINDLGILRLLLHIHQGILSDYTQEYLSPLITSDLHHGTDYITTLQAYIQHQGKINEVSEKLYIHPNTLRNRIKKIEEMSGIDFQNPEEFSNLLVAVRILSFLHP